MDLWELQIPDFKERLYFFPFYFSEDKLHAPTMVKYVHSVL